MTTLRWDPPGSDVLAGDPEACRELAGRFRATAIDAGEAGAELTRIRADASTSIWRGQGADAFREQIGKLPSQLRKLHDSYDAASQALVRHGRELEDLQAEARRLQQGAATAREEELTHRRRMESGSPELAPAAQSAMKDAQQRAQEAERRLGHLEERLRAAEDRTIAALRDAQELGIQNSHRGLLGAVVSWAGDRLHDIDQWVERHADLLRSISSGLKAVSLVAGLLSFVPVLTPICGPIALWTAGAALAVDGVLVATGNGDVKHLAVDAALMLLPGAGKLASRALMGRRATPVAARFADDTAHLPSKTRPATVAVLRTRNLRQNVFRGATKQPAQLHPRLQAALDRIPARLRSDWHGKCAEIKAINQALAREGGPARLKDAVVATRKVRPDLPTHNTPHAPCTSCQHVLSEFGIRYIK